MQQGCKADIITLLHGADGLKTLLDGGKLFGVSINQPDRNDTNGIIDLGNVPLESLPTSFDEVPQAYLQFEELSSGFRFVKQPLVAQFSRKLYFKADTLISMKTFDAFPKSASHVRILNGNGTDTLICGKAGDMVYFDLEIKIPYNFVGKVKKLVILQFEATEQINLLSSKTVSFVMGLQVFGNVAEKRKIVHDGRNGYSGFQIPALSVEAKPFVPISVVVSFDNWVPVVSYQLVSQAFVPQFKDSFTIPANYAALLSSIRQRTVYPPAQLIQDFLNYSRNNTLEQLLLSYGLLDGRDMIADDASLNALGLSKSSSAAMKALISNNTKHKLTTNPLQYLEMLDKLATLEEVQMAVDIAQYDMRYERVRFERKIKQQGGVYNPYTVCNTLIGRMVVKGSSESRPLLLVGDLVRLRNVEEDYMHVPEFVCIAPELQHLTVFEVQATIIHYNLATEEVTFEFDMPVPLFYSPMVTSIDDALQILNAVRYNVRFTFQRNAFFFLKQAMNQYIAMDPYLMETVFPTAETVENLLPFFYKYFRHGGGSRSPIKGQLALELRADSADGTSGSAYEAKYNEQQLTAINMILQLTACERYVESSVGSIGGFLPLPPFIIFGPPGTGKTCTIIESILRIYATHPTKRILACAPSDAAADVICMRLIKYLNPMRLCRLNWWQRLQASVPLPLRKYCIQQANEGLFELPVYSQLKEFQVVVCTCGTAGVLHNLVDPMTRQENRATFDVIFVDEASQALESEGLIPVSLLKKGGLVVLSGDTNQLGPITRFPLFRMCTDTTSLQERLLRVPIYSYCMPSNATKTAATELRNLVFQNEFPLGVFLFKNYRSHKCILEVPSRLFYNNALEECGDKAQIESLCKWEMLPQQTPFPLLFVGVDGKHQHELESPSFYNIEEAEKVVQICSNLVTSTAVTVAAKDIGVIAAFRKQVLKIRLLLRAAGLGAVNVGSVEDFQGQEVKVIVISTVLSSWVNRFENKGSIGLIGDRKKFNVAVTRGMALCVVVGQPFLLYGDSSWRALMEYCDHHGAYTGMPCKLLQRYREAAEEDALLDLVADMTFEDSADQKEDGSPSLGSGIPYSRFDTDMQYYDLQWRNLL